MRALLFTLILAGGVSAARAQIDPSSALLLNNGGRGTNKDVGVESGRYTVRPRGEGSARRDDTRSAPGSKRNSTTTPTTAQETQVHEAPTQQSPGEEAATVQSSPVPPAPSSSPVPPLSSAEAMPVGVEEDVDADARSSRGIIANDRRLNLLEISLAPAFIYNDSNSSFAYRSYNSASPAVAAEANIWISSEFAVRAGYLGTLSGHVNDSFNGSKNASTTQQWFSAGLRSRRFFGVAKSAAALTFGIDYMEYRFHVPSDAVIRQKLGTTGVVLSVEAEIPVNAQRSWVTGFSLAPKLQHKEEATSVDFQSGGSVDANAVGLTIGGRYQFDRVNAIFWKITHTIENDLFSGDATVSDPVTGITPSGVAVTNSFTVLQFGYTWGN